MNSSLSFGQAAVTFCLPSAPSCLRLLMIDLVRGWLTFTLGHWASELLKLQVQLKLMYFPNKRFYLSQTTGQDIVRPLVNKVGQVM